jgi:hypothetical protein
VITKATTILREHSRNIQGTFREHSGNIQGTFSQHSVNIQPTFTARGAPQYAHPCRTHLCIQGTFREYSGNIQGTFREHSGNIQGISREHSVNIQPTFTARGAPQYAHPHRKHMCTLGTFREHSVNIQSTFSQHSEDIQSIQGTFREHHGTFSQHSLPGVRRGMLIHAVNICAFRPFGFRVLG